MLDDEIEPTNEHAKQLWNVCCATIRNPDCVGLTQQIALFVKWQLEMEEHYERLTEKFYAVKEERDRLLWEKRNA